MLYAIADAYPKLNNLKPSLYIYIEIVVVDMPGPPLVNNVGSVNNCNVPMVDNTRQNKITALSCGKVT